jgi:hypothetical protein
LPVEQSFVKDPGKSVQDYLNEMIAKLGEKWYSKIVAFNGRLRAGILPLFFFAHV